MKTARRAFSLLVCVGGDGTLDNAANAAISCSAPFLPVPSGFGNLFGRALGHSNRVDRVVDLIEHGEEVSVDVGRRNGERFLCHESFGLLSEIQQSAETGEHRPRARWRRRLGYYTAALRYLRNTPLPRLRVAIDGRLVADDASVVTVANVETYGALLMLTPEASPIDGLFDVFVMRGDRKRDIMTRLLGWHLHVPGTRDGALLVRGRRVTVFGRGSRDELVVEPGALRVVVSTEVARALERGAARIDRTRQVA